MKRIGFYHSVDPDGWCSGALLHKYFELDGQTGVHEGVEVKGIEIYGMDYDYEFPWDKIDKETEVWMVDFSLSGKDMARLKEECFDLIWFDHHAPRLKEVEELGLKIAGLQSADAAGCDLLWSFLYPGEENRAVYLIGRYDIWKWHDVPGALEFNVGLRTRECINDPTSPIWRTLLGKDSYYRDMEIAKLTELGEQLLDYRNQGWWLYAKGHTFRTEFYALESMKNYSVGACNTDSVNSQFFDGLAMQERFPDVDFFVTFAWKRGQWRLGLWKPEWLDNDIHCGEIAQKFGGGGHPGAAGFYRTEELGLPFELK